MNVIRCSMLPGVYDCHRRAAAKQFRKAIASKGFALRETSPSVGSSAGTATHHAIAEFLRAKWREETIATDDAIEPAIIGFREEVGKGCEWDDTSPNQNTAENQIISMVNEYRRAILPGVDPLTVERNGVVEAAVELALKANIRDGWQLTGSTDLIDITYSVHDTKTGSLERPYYAQLGGYSLLCRSEKIIKGASRLQIDFLKRTRKTKIQEPAKSIEYPVAASERAAWATINDVINCYEKFMETGDPYAFPFNTMSLMCSAKFCPAFSTDFCELTK